MLLSKLDWQRHLSLYQTQKLRTQATGTPQRGCFPNLYTQPPSTNNLQPMGKAPPVPPRVTQPIYDAEAKILCASTSIPDLKSYAAVSPENRYQRSGTPIPDSTSPAAIGSENQDQRSSAPMPGSGSAAATGSPYDPQIFVKNSWDGSVPSREQTPTPEDGMTDDLCGLHMSAKKARELGHAMGFQRIILRTKSAQVRFKNSRAKTK